MIDRTRLLSICVAEVLLLVAGCAQQPPTQVADNALKATASEIELKPIEPQAAAESSVPTSDGPQLAPPANETQEPIAQSEPKEPQRHTAFYRADAGPAEIPPVTLSKSHQALCKVKVGDVMPRVELPKVGDNALAKLADLSGEKATVIVFWKGDRRMAREQLADIGPDVVEPFADKGVAVVGIAVDETAQNAQSTLQKAEANFPNLLDTGGKAFAQVGSQRLPRTYVLDAQGKVVWFDIEYSHSTRRELHQALRAITGN